MLSGILPFGAMAESTPVNVWWPTDGSHVANTQPFKAQVSGLNISSYEMYWQVDGGTWNHMDNNNTDYPHKEASVNVSGWSWHGAGPYKVNFVAQQNGAVISQQAITIYIDNGQPIVLPSAPVQTTTAVTPSTSAFNVQVSAPASAIVAAPLQTQATPVPQVQTVSAPVVASPVQVAPAPQPQVTAPVATAPANTSSNSSKLYVNPNSSAAGAGNSSQMQLLASQPTATWFGNWNSDIRGDVQKLVSAAAQQNATPVMVAYNIPARDCGGYSSGGSNSVSGYQSWIGSMAAGIGSNSAIVVLEPDALSQINCLSSADQATRLSLLSGAVAVLKANPNTKVYIDAGHSNWIDPGTMAGNLQKAGIAQADGFALNVSNFNRTSDESSYGQQISSKIGGKHFIIDTSRNGNGSDGQWCNPQGAAIGTKPTLQTGNSLIDGLLWIKTPGESDGNCNGGPGAGQWWSSYAYSLVNNAH